MQALAGLNAALGLVDRLSDILARALMARVVMLVRGDARDAL
jgi:hypothetical protein